MVKQFYGHCCLPQLLLFLLLYQARKSMTVDFILNGYSAYRKPATNTGFASGGLTCKLGTLCFYSSSSLIDSLRSETRPNAKPETVLCKLKTHRTFSTFWFSSRTSQRYKNQKELNFSHAEMTMFKTLFLYLTKIVKLCWIL